MDNLHQIRIYRSERAIGNLTNIPWNTLTEVTTEFVTGPKGWATSEETLAEPAELRPPATAREVFVVHGRNLADRDALFDFLRSIDLHPLEWSEAVRLTGKPSPYIGDILDTAFLHAQAVVVLFTPDDQARLHESLRGSNEPPHETELTGQARPNVLFEAGMAMGRSPDRTVLVEIGVLRPFSDIAGRHLIRIDNTSSRRQDLAHRLRAAGCPVNLEGTAWHKAGNFEEALSHLSSESISTVEQESNPVESLQLSEEAKELLIEAANDNYRMIRMVKTMGGLSISTNGKSYGEMGNPRSEARWEQAIFDLLDKGLIRDPKGKGQVFEVTPLGFQVAESLGESTW